VQLYGHIIGIYRRSGERVKGRRGRGRRNKEGEKKRGREEVRGSQGKVRRDGSHEWEQEGSGDCGIRIVIEESGISKSSRHGAKRRGCFKTYR